MKSLTFGRNTPTVLSYTLSFACVGVALGASLLVQDAVPGVFAFLFLAAVLAVARLKVRGAVVLAILLSTLAVAYFFLPPLHSFRIERAGLPLFFSYVGYAFLIMWLMAE